MASIEEQLQNERPSARGVRRPRRRRFLASEALVWVLCLAATAVTLNAVRDALANPPQNATGGAAGFAASDSVDPFHGKTTVQLLLVGTDQEAGLCDTIMVAFINRRTQRIGLFSIPRDTLVELSNGEHCKINAVLNLTEGSKHDIAKGLVALEKSVNQLLGIRIDAYVRIDVKAFKEVVDAIGGVDVTVPPGPHGNGLHYDDREQHLNIHLQPGPQHLKGYDAMGFVRWRKDNCPQEHCSDGAGAAGDGSRMKRQQQFLQAVTSAVAGKLRANKLEATKTALDLARIACRHLTTNLTLGQVQAIAQMARAVDVAGIDAQSAPLARSNTDSAHGFYYILDEAQAGEAVRNIVTDLGRTKPLSKMARIEVLNACGAPEIAAKCQRQLAQIEFRVVRSGNYTDEAGNVQFGHETSTIRCVPQFAEAASEIKKNLGLPEVEVRTDLPESSDVDVVITLGRDFAGTKRSD